MKNFRILLLIIVITVSALSCKKGYIFKPGSVNAFNIINATVNSQPVVSNFSNVPVKYYAEAQTISYGSSFEYSILSGNVPLYISQITDTTHTIFKGSFNLKPNTIYSLFLTGQITSNSSQVDTLLTIDNPPYYSVKDSVAGVRFVNLSPGSNPISIDIQGNANGSEVASLAYKKITPFKAYINTSEVPASGQYVFEFRDAASGTLLTTFTYNYMNRFENVTIIFDGLPSNQSVFMVNNF
jgi:hypothetical protein